jgi:hypothetical protein
MKGGALWRLRPGLCLGRRQVPMWVASHVRALHVPVTSLRDAFAAIAVP